MALERTVRVWVDGFAGRLVVAWVRGIQRMHAPDAVEVSAEVVDSSSAPLAVDIEALVGRTAHVALALGDGGERTVHGVVEDVEQHYGELRLVVAPRVAPLGDAIDHRVFLKQDAVAIAREVLQEHGVDVVVRVTRALPERGQCVQAFESDSRLRLAHLGRGGDRVVRRARDEHGRGRVRGHGCGLRTNRRRRRAPVRHGGGPRRGGVRLRRLVDPCAGAGRGAPA